MGMETIEGKLGFPSVESCLSVKSVIQSPCRGSEKHGIGAGPGGGGSRATPRNVGGLYVGNLGGNMGDFCLRTLVLDTKLMYDVFG